MGFRPTRPELAALMAAEERRIATDPTYRTPARALRRLSAGNIVYEAPGAPRGDWDRFILRNLALAVQRRMAEKFDGDAAKIRKASAEEVERVLGARLAKPRKPERRAFENLALVLALIPDLTQWTDREKKDVVQIIRAKFGADESRYARLLQRHARLRAAIIRLGEKS